MLNNDIGVYVVIQYLCNQIRVSTGYDTRVDADVLCNEALTRILVWKKDSHHIQYFPLFQSTIIVLLTEVNKHVI
jgi:hypothetical protein